MGTEAVHRALVRHAQNELGRPVGVPNDVGFENFDWQSVKAVRDALEELGIGYGVESNQPGRFYEYPGDPLAQRRRHPRHAHGAGVTRVLFIHGLWLHSSSWEPWIERFAAGRLRGFGSALAG